MSEREQCIKQLERIDDSKITYILTMIKAYADALESEKRREYAEDIAKAAADPEFVARSEKCAKDFEAVDNEEFADGDEW